ncbi:hypothetical protein QTP70_013448 [Hemibagrus guttatus]|uniref:Endonuclease/exonuclease/phosphatase domain-containing protein n=1 Tax=Hemibagrus guttatus TaxID=175788 RepID=A0AAE0PTA5_9TELE|nr:hypothetical protein QTP70_013448 [Hemibagrus guttatus]
MTGKGRELADVMERRKVDILCVQETRWKGSKARSIGAGFKLFYYGVDSKRNGVGVVLKEEFVRNVLEVKRVSDRVMSLKLEIEGVMLNVVSGYAPQVGCELEEKERFWSELDEVMESIPTGERVVIGVDFNGHVGGGNRDDEEVMGKFGVKERNLEGQMVVDFAKRMDMAVVNTYFQKREEHRMTYKSGGRRTQVDYILCRRGNLKEISDCKVVVGESVARQHRMVVCRMTLMVCKKKRSKIEIEKKTKWWKLKKEECCEEFRQKLRQALGGQVVLPDDWETTAEVIRETGRKVLGVSSGRRKEDKETWWWNEEVQDSVHRNRLAKKKWDMDRTEENRQEYKELQRRVKREVSKAKQKAYDELYTRLDTREGEKDLYSTQTVVVGGLWNCQPAVRKADFISALASHYSFDFLTLTETWISPQNTATPAALSSAYTFSHSPRESGRGGGTVSVTSPINLFIIVIYRPPGPLAATHKEGNVLDLVFTHPSPATDMTVTPLHISDHHLVSFTITLPVLPKRNSQHLSLTRRNLHSISPSSVASCTLSSLPDHESFSSLPLDSATDTLLSSLSSTMDLLCPLSTIRKKNSSTAPWLSDMLCNNRRELRSAARKWKKSKLDTDLISYRTLLSKFSLDVTSAKTSFYKEKLETSAQDPRKLHNIFSSLLNPPAPPSPSSLTAEDFATFYTEKTERICQTFTSLPTSPTSHSQHSATPSLMQLSTVASEEVLQITQSCNHTTCPLDPIPSAMLQTISAGLLPFITTVINGFLTSGHVPAAFKKARVIPILKKPALDPSDISNYRPESWNLWNSMGMVCFLPGWSLISDTMASARISACLADISSWMTAHQLKLNPSKTELLIIPGDPSPAQDLAISLRNSMISPSATARNLGVTMDNQLSFSSHVTNVTRSCRFLLYNIRRIQPFLSTQATQVLVQSLVISRLDYCNSLLAGLPLNAIRPLQMIQNAAARLVFNLPKFSHTTPLLRSLHWLPVAAHIRFKTLMLAYKAKNGPAPSYLKALVTPRTAPRSLRSTSTARLVPPSLREKARQRDRDGKDVQQVRVIKDRDGRVLTSEESVQRRWKEYFEELMNEENEREKRVEGVNSVEQKVDKIRKDEVRKALKRMKSGKAVGPDDIPVEIWKCLGEAAVEFLASLFNRVLENLEKAYDRVPREELWYCMRKSGVAEKYVRVVQDMYERSRTVVRCAVVMDQLSEEVRQESPWTMMFADDIVICSESREQVEENLERWRFALERRGMKSNGECGKEVKKRVQAETVSLRKRQESELEVAELKMLRFSLGVTRLDRIRNEYIRGTAHVGRLGDKVRETRLRWFGHVQRRESGPPDVGKMLGGEEDKDPEAEKEKEEERQEALRQQEEERKAKYSKMEAEREVLRQGIRDKYGLKKREEAEAEAQGAMDAASEGSLTRPKKAVPSGCGDEDEEEESILDTVMKYLPGPLQDMLKK